MPYLRNYHIMISHSWDYADDYNTIKRWLDSSAYFQWSDFSVPVDRALDAKSKLELKMKLSNRIAACSCIIILSGMYVAYSEWIDYEMEMAKKYNKPIIGVIPRGQERVPEKVQRYASIMVGWNSESVISAIRNNALLR